MQSHRKHILFLASWYPQRNSLDNGDFIQRHAQAVATLHDVTVVHAIKDPRLKKAKFEIEQRSIQGVKEIIVYVKPSLFRPFNFFYLLQGFLVGIQQVKSFDLIHLNVVFPAGIIALYLKSKFKVPLVLTEHWSGLQKNNYKKLALYKRFFIRRILENVDYLLPVSLYLEENIKRIHSDVRSKIIPNVIDLNNFERRVEEVKKNETIHFLHLSNLKDDVKNISGILNASKQLANKGYPFKLSIGGNGDLTFIQEFVTKNHLVDYISVFGRLEHHMVAEKMKSADCFILFSRFENQPCVQIESFASGLPVISSDVGGIKNFFPSDFGILIESENEDQLCEAMIEVIEGRDFASVEKMYEYVKFNFSKEEISQQYHQIYQDLIK